MGTLTAYDQAVQEARRVFGPMNYGDERWPEYVAMVVEIEEAIKAGVWK